MPFQSRAQARFMFAKHPKMAKEWASKTESIKSLPDHKGHSHLNHPQLHKSGYKGGK